MKSTTTVFIKGEIGAQTVPEKRLAARTYLSGLQTGRKAGVNSLRSVPLGKLDEKLGKGFLKPEQFARIAYEGLLRHKQ